ncbi:MAG: hypothetical protein GKS05_05035 [Nitrospirales bacterium]|nr:hypothetical protein [Nitrospirales bacterium]
MTTEVHSLGKSSEFRRSMYVDGWNQLYLDPKKVTTLGRFCHSVGITELHLYDLHCILCDAVHDSAHQEVIESLKTNHGIQHFNAAYSCMTQLDDIARYQDTYHAFSGTILECEWWRNEPRDFSTALCCLQAAAASPLEVHAYTGWFQEDEVADLCSAIDVLHLHAYRPDGTETFSYTKSRLELLSNHSMKVVPLFSAEPDFMGPWLHKHGLHEAERLYDQAYQEWAAKEPTKLVKIGVNYFAYSHLAKAVRSD